MSLLYGNKLEILKIARKITPIIKANIESIFKHHVQTDAIFLRLASLSWSLLLFKYSASNIFICFKQADWLVKNETNVESRLIQKPTQAYINKKTISDLILGEICLMKVNESPKAPEARARIVLSNDRAPSRTASTNDFLSSR